ncbi:MAG: PhoH family protein [Elusimicrobiaceae bacterium]|nr:PhoH family protein [Elusimicrobiaceae bacterium]
MPIKKIRLETREQAVCVLGVQDEQLRRLERDYKVELFVRHEPGEAGGVDISIKGPISRVDKALNAITDIISQKEMLAHAEPTQPGDKPSPISNGVIYHPSRGLPVKLRNAAQTEYANMIFGSDMVIGIGPAGTGKTFVAAAAAMRSLEMNLVDRIILTRPIVEAGEKLGFLPGDLYEKVHPYLRPLYDAFQTLAGPERFRNLREDGVLEIVPLAYMRGRTLENAFIILDEAQNTMPEQMKMFLTRMGMNSKVVVTGDITQIDLEDKNKSGLFQITHILQHTEGIKFFRFNKEDIVRHPLVKEILAAYENWENKKTKKPM